MSDVTAWETVREAVEYGMGFDVGGWPAHLRHEEIRARSNAALASLQAAYEAMERERDERLAVNVGLIAENTELKRKIARRALEPRAEA